MIAQLKTRHEIAAVEDLPPGERKIVKIGAREVGVFNVNGQFKAVLNICPHELAPVCQGKVRGTTRPTGDGKGFEWCMEGQVLLCPWHGWEFDLADGKSLHDPSHCHLKTFETVVEDGKVFVVA